MHRYVTRANVAINRAEAERLANLDGTPASQIEYTANVEVIHIHIELDYKTHCSLCTWVWWSDGRITTANGLPANLRVSNLSKAAVELITLAVESDSLSRRPNCGWRTLANIKQIRQRKLLAVGKDMYQSETLEQLSVEYLDGNRGTLCMFCSDFNCVEIYDINAEFVLKHIQVSTPNIRSIIADIRKWKQREKVGLGRKRA